MISVLAILAFGLFVAGAVAVALALKLGEARVAESRLYRQLEMALRDHGAAIRDRGREVAAHVETRTRLQAEVKRQECVIARLQEEYDAFDPCLAGPHLAGAGLLRGSSADGTTHADRPTAAGGLPGTGVPGVAADRRQDRGR